MNALKRQASGLARHPSYIAHKREIAAIGIDPKYLSAHQRRKAPSRLEWLAARDAYRAKLKLSGPLPENEKGVVATTLDFVVDVVTGAASLKPAAAA